ncbi:carcinoembryonic antigen-related cell adhesion molecule 1-like [Toxotes jaculatrix]|uniref:carcinoembryonic antigen-related cell adhesion molecule 1-like n=1 Tax=Toxotes jaculatrix TaxID=941984 RepID=UPI001B3AD584|nr:carcinoembryonic antigen-related cell adhesion molecule 1-like [Toxotes jaculatrix]
MLRAEAGCVFMGFILYISGVQGRVNRTCALRGSSVALNCSAKRPTSSMKWYTVRRNGSKHVQKELSAGGKRVIYNMSEDGNFTLTIKNLRESDENVYCCQENTNTPENCWSKGTKLQVADLQVKVIPTTEGQKVTLMCSTSCPLTENPEAYIWYKNREFLYNNWSPWYQELVSSEEDVKYSCAIKGYEDLRAPEVSVDSVTATCFTVTYAKGRMCSSNKTSVKEPCSITYPREVQVQKMPAAQGEETLTCNTSCPLTDSQSAYRWYKNRQETELKSPVSSSSPDSFSCAVKGHEDLLSEEVCIEEKPCCTVKYINRRICVLQSSSVNISSEYSCSDNKQPGSQVWYKRTRSAKKAAELLLMAAEPKKSSNRVFYNEKNHHILTINKLKKNDSAEYIFSLQTKDEVEKQSEFHGVTLVVTNLKLKISPAEVTKGQRVTLTCITSCPLTNNTIYIWQLNNQTLPGNHSKYLVLDPVRHQDQGNYSCAVNNTQIRSGGKILTVVNSQFNSTERSWTPVITGVVAVLLVIIPITAFLWIRRKRTSSQSHRTVTSDNMEQLSPGPLYDDISAQPTEQDDLHYSSVCFSKDHTEPTYSVVQPRQTKEQEHTPYAVVNFRPRTAPE